MCSISMNTQIFGVVKFFEYLFLKTQGITSDFSLIDAVI